MYRLHSTLCKRPMLQGPTLHGLTPVARTSYTVQKALAHMLVPLSSTSSSSPAPSPDSPGGSNPPQSIPDKLKAFLASSAKERERIASLGSAFVLSYGLVSNLTYVTCLAVAWISFVKTRGGLTPLDEGQWAPFLLYYGGLWTVQNFARPLRFAVAAGLAPGFDKSMEWLAGRLPGGWGKKAAFGILLSGLALVSITSFCCAVYFGGGLPRGLGPLPPLSR
jgi:hypothetical protein